MRKELVAIELDEFEAKYLETYREIIVEDSPPRRAFVNESWEKAFLSYTIQHQPEAQKALAFAAERCGDEFVIVTDTDRFPMHSISFKIPVDRADLLDMEGDIINHFEHALFGMSKRWGMVCYNTDAFTVVGGDKTFVDAFTRAMGGIEAIRKEFSNFIKEPVWDSPEEVTKELIESVGWPWPL